MLIAVCAAGQEAAVNLLLAVGADPRIQVDLGPYLFVNAEVASMLRASTEVAYGIARRARAGAPNGGNPIVFGKNLR